MKSLKKYLNETILTYQEFVQRLAEREDLKAAKDRLQFLADIKKSQYAIKLTLKNSDHLLPLLEHEPFKRFSKTSNRYMYHPENLDIPVKAHYHIYPSNSKKELYAVNVDDGSAHHKKNKGHIVPKKEADELKALGVKFKQDNILENLDYNINESAEDDFVTIYIIVDE